MSCRVSWLIPSRDAERWLQGAVDSALSASGPEDEILVVDDGSRIPVSEYLRGDRRLHILRQDPRGIVAAMEAGRELARGEFIARLDADDQALPDRLTRQLPLLKQEPRLAAVGGQARLLPDPPPGEGMVRYLDWIASLSCLHAALLIESPLLHPTVTLRASALESAGGYREGDFPEDYELWLRLVEQGWGIRSLPQVVCLLRDHQGRLTRRDPRYRRPAFDQLKRDWLSRAGWEPGTELGVWGAGRRGKAWVRWGLQRGLAVTVIDPYRAGRTCQGLTVHPPERLLRAPPQRLLVAVGARGARAEIRAWLRTQLPSWKEGIDWRAVA